MGLFKKPKPQEQESGNKAYDDIKNAYGGAMGYTTGAGNMLSGLLGVGGTAGQTDALNNFANSGGMQFLRDNINKQVTSNKAASGLLGSGSLFTTLQDRGFGLSSTYLNQYMDKLLGLGNLGLGAGGLVSNTGQWSKGQGATQGGMGKQLIPMVASAALTAAASDPALKTNVELVGHDNDNTPVYEFNYRQDTPLDLPEGRFRGYMADTLLLVDPKAVVKKNGFLMVTNKKYFPKRIDD